jgi:hypothetical protein
MRRGVSRGIGTGMAVVLLATVHLISAGAVATENPLDRARRAAETASFVGILQVWWLDGGTEHSERLTVQSSDGAVVVRGANQVMAAPGAGRLLQHDEGGWDLLWSPRVGLAERPDVSLKYRTADQPGPQVADRPTRAIDVEEDGLLRERVYLDAESSLVLKREQFDPTGAVTRRVAFDTMVLDPATPPPPPPAKSSDQAPKSVPPERLGAGLAPDQLAEGYRRLGVYRRSGVVQVLYSDGMYDLSVFEQPGRLDRGSLGAGGLPVSVGKATGWRYTWPGGHVVLWQAGGRVYTVVSGAPLDQVVGAASSLPAPAAASPSMMERLRRVARAVIQPLA